ncbi:MAG: aldehyde dehydrogenase [gamma proteobacterium symbiont of Ctena orbiculata]|uniref:Aldehyde dehydrogenase family protein n=1 Tax=Candidatus Thiodiazotropha taylori TaxID=2792791 RepID=A0A944QVD7_9GAMM|nr:aldehyde dehydrogenase family protein [Candidatus Thiodiazotropha taylori]PUB82472.1 MAG: aldehyde dehydrogenase [gamma proteobacterium symbiont of Ctena orbiculata]MBT2989326.1 aldehyde dehydrogenase family protein [Candidatus Thiodiazotropha taylori]MBT2996906.1 aldehyde dehydrogenase family protein [Candidatus Thiodiazotropha taylori]MBT3000761.1 aldehyde dehydrogenase family protein [Candidatus Thiodiazotropha taylori]
MTTAAQAIDQLNPQKWAETTISERLALLQDIRENLKTYGDELASSDTEMKNALMGEALFTDAMSKVSTVVPVANTVTASIDLYEGLKQGRMIQPGKIEEVSNGLWDITVKRPSATERAMYGANQEILRVKGRPQQINPLDKPAKIIAVLGAGNYSSALEIITALFLENCVVVHKAHHLNQSTDRIWERVLAPLVEHNALSFADHDQGPELTKDARISKIYFTGGTGTAQAILAATDAELVSECGGNNPCIIVPGDRPWSQKEIDHQAQMIVSVGKLNGGAVCGRPQTLVTSKHWAQREAFLSAFRKAILEETPAAGTYYPGSDKVREGFMSAYPNAEVLKPESGRFQSADVILIAGVEEVSYATANEAFCQIFDEVALDAPGNAAEFLPAAVKFANEKLLGTLSSSILIDEDTKKAHQSVVDRAVTNLEYGAVAVNEMPPNIWLSPYLTWSGNEEGKTFVSGNGNFGNAMNFQNVEKSILIGSFMSPGHMIIRNKAAFDTLALGMARFSVEPGWINLIRLMSGAITGSFKKRDF